MEKGERLSSLGCCLALKHARIGEHLTENLLYNELGYVYARR